jgi:predicted enzyme related to lactoylglutathione lyase
MNSPLQRRVGKVFIPVSDIAQAARWYSALFGLPLGAMTHGGKIYDLPMEREPG